MNEVEIIQKNLKKGYISAHCDMAVFKQWEQGDMSYEEMREAFFDNNNFPEEDRTQISKKGLLNWLNSIGWKGL